MKRSKLLITGIILGLSFFIYTPTAHASQFQTTQSSGIFGGLSDWLNSLFGNNNNTNNTSGSTSGSTSGGTSLPIDTHVWYLVVAGAVVGTRVIIRNSKKLAPQKI
ncbi:MAG TPA: hypothetical protein VHA56_20695 [Mucilaginibacter sp.]|nr:hypothetical protein [Mucilaginibacter sp.]